MTDLNEDECIPVRITLEFDLSLPPDRVTLPDFDEDEFFTIEAEFAPHFARGHQITRQEADELIGLLGVDREVKGFWVSIHFGIAGFVEAKIDKFCHPIDTDVSETLAAVASGDYSDLQGTGRGAVIVRSTLEHYSRATTSALETLEEGGRLVGIAASLKEAMRKERKRPADDELDDFLGGYYALAAHLGASLRLGSNAEVNSFTPPLVKSAKRALSLVAERGLAVLEHRPAIDEVRALDAAAYFRDISNMDARRITRRLRKIRNELARPINGVI